MIYGNQIYQNLTDALDDHSIRCSNGIVLSERRNQYNHTLSLIKAVIPLQTSLRFITEEFHQKCSPGES